MTSLRSAYFFPQSGSIALYKSEDGYSKTRNLLFANLPTEQHQIAAGAMQWLAQQLPDGMQSLQQVILERLADVPTAWSEATEEQPAEPTAWSPAFSISVTGSGPLGESTQSITSTPGALTDATAALWNYLAAI